MEIEWLYATFFIIIFLILVLSHMKKSWPLRFIGGSLMVVLGIYTFISGITGYDSNWFDVGRSAGWIAYTSIVITFMGLYFVLEIFNNTWEAEDGT